MSKIPLGRCFGIGSDIFFNIEREQEAKKICNQCPEKDSCLGSALERREDYGVWGGANWKERLGMLGIKPENASRRARIYECP